MSGVKSIYSIIKAPVITEKSSLGLPKRKYVFQVDPNANKVEVKNAVEKLYKVTVTDVTTAIVKGKTKRLRFNQPGKTTAWKKATVTLKEGNEIKLT
ncbi:MAG: 50S ribosomal protein L23 [Candidatus Omnitrophica bacterium]|nr:50S ribosomal protein L23 [Candidatus Omnitrophota bacterium]